MKVENSQVKVLREKYLKEVKEDGLLLENMDSYFKSDSEIVLNAINQNRMAFHYATNNLKNSENFIKEAIKKNPHVFTEIDNKHKNNADIIKTAVEYDVDMFFNIPNSFIQNNKEEFKEILKSVIIQKPEYLKYCDEKIQNDPELIKLYEKSIKIDENNKKISSFVGGLTEMYKNIGDMLEKMLEKVIPPSKESSKPTFNGMPLSN